MAKANDTVKEERKNVINQSNKVLAKAKLSWPNQQIKLMKVMDIPMPMDKLTVGVVQEGMGENVRSMEKLKMVKR